MEPRKSALGSNRRVPKEMVSRSGKECFLSYTVPQANRATGVEVVGVPRRRSGPVDLDC